MRKKYICAAASVLLILLFSFTAQAKQTPARNANYIRMALEALAEPSKDTGEIKLTETDIVAAIETQKNLILLLNIYTLGFTPDDGLFSISSGSSVPAEIRFKKVSGLWVRERVIFAGDGSYFVPSVKKIARGRGHWYRRLMSSQNGMTPERYGIFISRLAGVCRKGNLRGYFHKENTIPGFQGKEVVILPGGNNRYGSSNKVIALRADYERAKAQIGKVNWPHFPVVIYNINTGIAVKNFGDFVGKAR